MVCKHKQCGICLRRECNTGKLTQYGEIWACSRCASKAILWAYTTACRWGGEYTGDKEACKDAKEIGVQP